MTTKRIIRFDWVDRPDGTAGAEWCVEVLVGMTALDRPDIDGPMTPAQALERHNINLPDALKAVNASAMARAETAEAALVEAHKISGEQIAQLHADARAMEGQIEKLQQLRAVAGRAAQTGEDVDRAALVDVLAELDGLDAARAAAAKGSRIAQLEAELAKLREDGGK